VTVEDPDPERSQGVAECVDARHYGDPEDERPAGVAPLCEDCGEREAVERIDGRDLCEPCIGDRAASSVDNPTVAARWESDESDD